MATKLKVKVRGRWFTVELEEEDIHSGKLQVYVDGEEVEVHLAEKSNALISDHSPQETVASQVPTGGISGSRPSAVKIFASPMPGVVISVAVKAGDQVVTGDEICVLEAMKMQQKLRADWSGIVKKIHVQPGEQVKDGAPIAELE